MWEVTGRDGLLACSGGNPFVRWATTATALGVLGRHGWAVLTPWRPGESHWGGLAVAADGAPGSAESSALAVLSALAEDAGVVPEWFSTSPGRRLEAPEGYAVDGGGTWDLLWTTGLPAGTVLPLVELHDVEDAAEIQAFGLRHNPAFEGFPGRGYAELWLGARDTGGSLVAAGAVHRLASGAPHLAGIVVDPAHRGMGLGGAITRQLTRWSLRGSGVSTLGVYADNVAALRLYHRLGYRTGARMHTRSLARRS